MKMSESFCLPVEMVRPYNSSELRDGVGDYLFDAGDDIDLVAISVAVNSHDDLVSSLESLLRMTENEPLNDIDEQLRYNAFKALRKARGES